MKTDRNHYDDLDQENAARLAIGLRPKPPHPADDRRRAEIVISAILIVIASSITAALIWPISL